MTHKYQTQKYQHKPEEGSIGDCFPTCLACLLNIPRDDVPHFFEDWEGDPKPQWEEVNEWLRVNHKVRLFKIVFDGAVSLDAILRHVSSQQPDYRYMLSGKSLTDVQHVVICKDGKINHDTSITQSGIVGPGDDGHWWIEFLVPIGGGFDDS